MSWHAMNGFVLTAAVVAMLAWGSGAIFDKLAFNSMEGLSPYSAVLVRMVFALVCIIIILTLTGGREDIRQIEPKTLFYLAMSGLLAGVLAQAAYYFAVDAGEISKVVLFTAAYPLVTVLLAAQFLREPLTWQKLLAAALIVGGLMLLAATRVSSS